MKFNSKEELFTYILTALFKQKKRCEGRISKVGYILPCYRYNNLCSPSGFIIPNYKEEMEGYPLSKLKELYDLSEIEEFIPLLEDMDMIHDNHPDWVYSYKKLAKKYKIRVNVKKLAIQCGFPLAA